MNKKLFGDGLSDRPKHSSENSSKSRYVLRKQGLAGQRAVSIDSLASTLTPRLCCWPGVSYLRSPSTTRANLNTVTRGLVVQAEISERSRRRRGLRGTSSRHR